MNAAFWLITDKATKLYNASSFTTVWIRWLCDHETGGKYGCDPACYQTCIPSSDHCWVKLVKLTFFPLKCSSLGGYFSASTCLNPVSALPMNTNNFNNKIFAALDRVSFLFLSGLLHCTDNGTELYSVQYQLPNLKDYTKTNDNIDPPSHSKERLKRDKRWCDREEGSHPPFQMTMWSK